LARPRSSWASDASEERRDDDGCETSSAAGDSSDATELAPDRGGDDVCLAAASSSRLPVHGNPSASSSRKRSYTATPLCYQTTAHTAHNLAHGRATATYLLQTLLAVVLALCADPFVELLHVPFI
jgi:hypothetical protein